MNKKTKIVSTIGPASESRETLKELMLAGINVCRLNFSHGDHDEHQERIDRIKSLREELGLPISIMVDLKGPEIRLGDFEDGKIHINKGETFTFTTRDILGDQTIVHQSHGGLPNDVEVGSIILVDDGLVEFEVKEIKDGTDIVTEALNSGDMSNHKGVNLPGVEVSLPAITEKDESDILFAIKNDVDWIAGSFIRTKDDVMNIREILENNGGHSIQIISKIENQQGVDNLDEILAACEGIMVARGDLGVEIPAEEIPMIQKDMIRKTYKAGKPVITATQMLDSMERNPRPTRAEVADVANAIIDGTSAIMLSGETAAGDYPIEAVKMMAKIALNVEKSLDYDQLLEDNMMGFDNTVTNAVSKSAVLLARDIGAGAIIAPTNSGYTARAVSKLRPKNIIVAATSDERTLRRMSLVWGVEPILTPETDNTDSLTTEAMNGAVTAGLLNPGELAVLTAGIPVGKTGSTNMIRVETAADLICSGIGVGSTGYTGKAVVIKDKSGLDRVSEGDILVIETTDKSMMENMEKIGGLIVTEAGLTSHPAIVGLNLGIPTILGARISEVPDGEEITIDAKTGSVFLGKVRVL